MTSSFFLILEVSDESDFFESGGPGVCVATLVQASDCGFVFVCTNIIIYLREGL